VAGAGFEPATFGLCATLVDVGLTHRFPQAAVGNPEVFGDLGDRLLAHAGQLNSTLTELRRMRSGHLNILPIGDHCLRLGVRQTGGSSLNAWFDDESRIA
jgi:hypothetical protein